MVERIAVIGNGGGGKTTLCWRLREELQLPLHEIDQIQFKPGWVRTPEEEVRARHDAILRERSWIIDGWGPWDAMQQRFRLADVIIFVDFPLHTHLRWAMKRQITSIFRPRLGGPEDCPLLPMTWEMMKTIYRVHKHYRPQLVQELDELEQQGAQIIHLQSPREFRQFLRNPYSTLSILARNPIYSDQ